MRVPLNLLRRPHKREAAPPLDSPSTAPRRRRLRPRYTLRAVLTFITAFAVWCAFHANRGRYERAVERDVVQAGGRVLIGRLDPITGNAIAPSEYQQLLSIVFAQRFISGIQIQNSKLREGLVDRALRLPHLTAFAAAECGITDDDLGYLAQASSLTSLSLPCNPVTDAGMSGLDGLVQLQFVNLERTAIGDETLTRLSRLPRLVTVSISNTSVSGKRSSHFSSTATLRRIVAEDTMLRDDFLVSIAKCNSLQSVLLENCHFTDTGVVALEGHASLEYVFLSGNKDLTDQSLDVLARLPRLKRAGMSGTRCTRAGVRAFRERRPDVVL